MLHRFIFLSAILALTACATDNTDVHVRKILTETPIVDTHIDFPWFLVEHNKWYQPGYTALALKNPDGDFDFERAKKGGLYGAFMSIYIPAQYQKEAGRSKQVADSLIDMVHAVVKDYPDKFALALHADDVMQNFKKGIVSLPMGMENGSPIESLADVSYFHERGIRYVTLTHSRDNKICDSSYDTLHTNGGLSEFGREVVREMNRVGIMVDVSHLSDESINDVLEVAKKPLIATHSGCRHFTPDFQRNLSDTLIKQIAKTRGVVQVPFSHYFLSSHARDVQKEIEKRLKDKGIDEKSPEIKDSLRAQLALVDITVRDVANQIDYIKNLVGIDYVGLGSDFDGVEYYLPPDLNDVSMYPNLLAELLRRGYSDSDIKKICYENVIRVWRENE